MIPRGLRQNTTHDWAIAVDPGQLARICRDPVTFAPGGVQHLVLEVVAPAADEAEASSGGRCVVTFHPRFFDSPDAQLLPDGHPRGGISVVAAVSEWLAHANRRRDGA